ncbi:MAG TPA: cation:proton antiporter [Candidatus Saccharimonadales bacterium]|nr:cation:proton antiporter [Candidatus Saccharimonadales bacterium]
MVTDTIFLELSLVIALAAGVALVMRLIRQPLIIGYILTGIIVGPSVLHLIKTPATITSFSDIGIALLLFIIGLGLNPRVIKEVGKVAAIIGVVQVGLTAVLGWAGATLLGAGKNEAILLGIAVSFSSTIIILKLLSDKKEQSRLYGKLAIGLLLVQDLIAMAALLWVSALQGGNGVSLHALEVLGFKGLAIVIGLFVLGWVVLPKLHKLIAGSSEFLFLFAIGYGFGAAALFAKIGASIEVGALLAGVSLASLPYTQEMSARLRPLRDFFVIVFFISLGTRLGFGNIDHLLPIIIFGTLVAIIAKPLIVLALLGVMGYTKQTSFKTAVAMGQISEFSLVLLILANHQGLISNGWVSALTVMALISIAVSTYLVLYNQQLYHVLERFLVIFERRRQNFERELVHRHDMILFGYQQGGHEFVKVFESLKKPFVVVDYDPDAIELLEHQKIPFIYGDAMDVELLEEAGLDKAKLVISTITDYKINQFLLELLGKINEGAVIILHADTVEHALQFYKEGASYVMLPHFVGSQKIGTFLRKNGLSKREFKHYRERHLAYLQHNYPLVNDA